MRKWKRGREGKGKGVSTLDLSGSTPRVFSLCSVWVRPCLLTQPPLSSCWLALQTSWVLPGLQASGHRETEARLHTAIQTPSVCPDLQYPKAPLTMMVCPINCVGGSKLTSLCCISTFLGGGGGWGGSLHRRGAGPENSAVGVPWVSVTCPSVALGFRPKQGEKDAFLTFCLPYHLSFFFSRARADGLSFTSPFCLSQMAGL